MSPTLAAGAGWPMTLPPAGTCTPAPDDGDYVARTVQALNVPVTTTKPIAVLDTGVDPSSPQLAGRVLPGYDALTGAPIAGDPDGHGTEVAGLAASAGPGMRGVSPGSPILPIRIYDANRATSADAVAKGVALAVQHGAGVVLISGSGPRDGVSGASAADLLKVAKAIDDAVSQGVLVVAAAGDENQPVPGVPGALPHVLTAGSATLAGTRATLTSAGSWLDVLAPGESVSGPVPVANCVFGFGFASGSSFAAPVLAGAAALVQARRPELTTQQLFEVIRRGADDLGTSGPDNDSGFGMLDVAKALTATPQAKESLPEVDDDPYWVRGAYAKAHPPLLSPTKPRFKVTDSVSPAKDPADVFPISLRKGDRIVVTVNAADPAALLELSILSPSAGDFDITNGVNRNRLLATGGLSNAPQLELIAKRTGKHYIAVEAEDPIDPDDASYVPSDIDPYRISAFKQHKKAKKKAVKKKARR